MKVRLRLQLWLAFTALCTFTVAELVYTEMYKAAVSADLMIAYKLLDAQLSEKALLAKQIFGWGEAVCLASICFVLWTLSQPNLYLRIAHGYMFALSMMNLADAVFGNYIESFEYLFLEYRYSVAIAFVSFFEILIAQQRGKHP